MPGNRRIRRSTGHGFFSPPSSSLKKRARPRSKDDLRRVLDSLDPGPVVLMGSSLGAAVALQEAADDRRVTVVVAAETFSDLRTIARERAPFFFTSSIITREFRLAEARGPAPRD